MNTLIKSSEENKYLDTNLIVEKNYKAKNTKKDFKITAIDSQIRQFLILSDQTPTRTIKLSEVQGFPVFPKLNFPASEYIYFPYLGADGMISSIINDNYVGTLMRSILRYEIKYETLEVNQEDAEFESYEFYGTIKGKNKELDDYFLQQLELYGHKYCSWIHYNSVMNLLKGKSYKERLELIEKFYNIKVEDERIKKGNLKVGILDEEGNYSKKDIGYIYNQDKLSGRAIDVPYYYGYKEDLEGMDTYGVCNNAILECSCGSKPNILSVKSQQVEYSDEELDATEEDKTTPGFIECSKKEGGCSPELTNWIGMSEGVAIEGKKCLLSTSTIGCKVGGVISIVNPNCKIKIK